MAAAAPGSPPSSAPRVRVAGALATVGVACAALLALFRPAAAQELPFRGPLGAGGGDPCGVVELARGPDARAASAEASATGGATDEARAQAVELARDAERAVILGNLERARSFLDRAVQLDPSSTDLAYRRARVLEELGDRSAAIEAYCAAALGPDGPDAGADRSDARERAARLASRSAPDGVSDVASAALERGVAAAEEGRYGAALAALDTALREAPRWPDAIYNRGVALARMGRSQEAVTELRRYLQEAPGAPDAVDVSRRIGQLEIMAERGAPSAGTAFTLGLLFPGLGQFYSGRVVEGFTVLALAGGAAAAGYLVKEVHVRCLEAVEPGERCPPDLVASRAERRPHLAPALAVAGGILALGAVEALIGARRGSSGDGPFGVETAGEGRVSGPSVAVRGTAFDLNLLTVHFR